MKMLTAVFVGVMLSGCASPVIVRYAPSSMAEPVRDGLPRV